MIETLSRMAGNLAENLASFLFQGLVFLLVVGVVVVFHEWGHFLAARLVGVRVHVFSFGFGKRLFGWQSVMRSGNSSIWFWSRMSLATTKANRAPSP